jgi:hypothetical protein
MRKPSFLVEFEDPHHQVHASDASRIRRSCTPLEPCDRPAIGEDSPCTLKSLTNASVPLRRDEHVDVAETCIAS